MRSALKVHPHANESHANAEERTLLSSSNCRRLDARDTGGDGCRVGRLRCGVWACARLVAGSPLRGAWCAAVHRAHDHPCAGSPWWTSARPACWAEIFPGCGTWWSIFISTFFVILVHVLCHGVSIFVSIFVSILVSEFGDVFFEYFQIFVRVFVALRKPPF